MIFAKRKRLRISQCCLQLTSQFIQSHCYIPLQYEALKNRATQSAATTDVIGVNGEFFNIESVWASPDGTPILIRAPDDRLESVTPIEYKWL